MVGNAIAQSAQPIISYNFGVGQTERVTATVRIALATAVACGLIVTLAFTLYPELLVGLFVDLGGASARIAVSGFPYFAAGFVFFVVNVTAVGYFQSVERVRPATTFALLRGFLFLVPSFLLLPQLLGGRGIWLALSLSELATTVVIVLYSARRRRVSGC